MIASSVIAVDPAATSDSAAVVAARMHSLPYCRLTVTRLAAQRPPITQDDIVALCEAAVRAMPLPVFVVDVGGSLGVVAALAARFGMRRVVGLRITAALEHALRPEPLMLQRRPPLGVPVWHVSRSRLLDDLRRAVGTGSIELPLGDTTQAEALAELRRELEGIAETVNAGGRMFAIADGHDDLAMSLSYAVWAQNTFGSTVRRAPRGMAPNALAWT